MPKSHWLASVALPFIISSFMATRAAAQEPTPPAPIRETIDENGIDLYHGQFVVRQSLISIGANHGISYDVIYRGASVSASIYGALDKNASGTIYWVTFDGRTERFDFANNAFIPYEPRGQVLQRSVDEAISNYIYTYTSRDGTVVRFSPLTASVIQYGSNNSNVARIDTITSPNGASVTYSYEVAQYQDCTGGRTGGAYEHSGGHGSGNIPSSRIYLDNEAIKSGEPRRRGAELQTEELIGTSGAGKGGATESTAVTSSCKSAFATRVATVANAYGYQLKVTYNTNTLVGPQGLNAWWAISGVEAKNLAGCGGATCTWPSTTSPNVAANTYVIDTTSAATAPSYHKVTSWRRYGDSMPAAQLGYDASGRVNSYADALESGSGKQTSYAYVDTTSERTVTVTNALNEATIYVFDLATERLKSIDNALHHKTLYDYYPDTGLLKTTTYPEGNSEVREYDTRGNLTKVARKTKASDSLVDLVSRWTYPGDCLGDHANHCNSPDWVVSEGGSSDNYNYNSDGTLKYVRPWNYNGAGNPAPEIRYTYRTLQAKVLNGSGELVNSGQPITLLETISQCRIGNVAGGCVGSGDETRQIFTYDVTKNLAQTKAEVSSGDGSLSAVMTTSYDAIGNVTAIDGPLPENTDTTTYRYDGYRRRVGMISPDPDGSAPMKRRAQRVNYGSSWAPQSVEVGTVDGTSEANWSAFVPKVKTDYRYINGLVTGMTQSLGGRTVAVSQVYYDLASRAQCVAQRMNPDQWSNITPGCTLQMAGPDGPDRISRTSYDATGQVSEVTSAFGTLAQADEVNYTYTDNGQIRSAADGLGNVTAYTYDGFDRIKRITYPVVTGGGSQLNQDYEEYTYDGAKLSKVRLRDAKEVGYIFDNAGHLKGKTKPDSEGNISYNYDLQNHLVKISLNNSQKEAFGYDALGRQTREDQQFGSMAYEYDLAGRRTKVVWNDDAASAVTYSYLITGEMDLVKEATGTASVIADYTYDDLGRRTKLNRGGNRILTSYGYQDAGGDTPNLTHLSHTFLNAVTKNVTTNFNYNTAGQIETATRDNDLYAWTGHYNLNRTYTHNELNQYASAGLAANKVIFSYDPRGNLTRSGNDAYTYTSSNMLKSRNNGTTLYYDVLERLVEYDTTVSTRFLYNGAHIAAKLDNGNTNNPISERYVWGAGPDELLAYYDAGVRKYAVQDERGSVIAYTGTNGAPIAINRYDEYGYAAAGNSGEFGYTGQLWLPELNLYSYKARMYAPSLGRFMQTDPIGYGDGMNWHNYVGADPVNQRDPTGTCQYAGTGSSGTYSDPDAADGVGYYVSCPSWSYGLSYNYDPMVVWAELRERDIVMTELDRRQAEQDCTLSGGNFKPDYGGIGNCGKAEKREPQQQSFAACAWKAAKKNAGVLALDAVSVGASFVPAGRGAVSIGAAIIGSTTGVATVGVGIANNSLTGAATATLGVTGHFTSNAMGIFDEAIAAGVGTAKYIPGLSVGVALVGAGLDIYDSLSEGGCFGGKGG